MSSRLIRLGVYLLVLFFGLSLTPDHLVYESALIGCLGVACVIVVQVVPGRTSFHNALAVVAVWAALSVLCAPLVPAFRFIGEAMKAAAGGAL